MEAKIKIGSRVAIMSPSKIEPGEPSTAEVHVFGTVAALAPEEKVVFIQGYPAAFPMKAVRLVTEEEDASNFQ